MSAHKGGIKGGQARSLLCTLHPQAGAWCERLWGWSWREKAGALLDERLIDWAKAMYNNKV